MSFDAAWIAITDAIDECPIASEYLSADPLRSYIGVVRGMAEEIKRLRAREPVTIRPLGKPAK